MDSWLTTVGVLRDLVGLSKTISNLRGRSGDLSGNIGVGWIGVEAGVSVCGLIDVDAVVSMSWMGVDTWTSANGWDMLLVINCSWLSDMTDDGAVEEMMLGSIIKVAAEVFSDVTFPLCVCVERVKL